MPANTPRGFPYPLPTEPVAEGAAAIRALAEFVDTHSGIFPIAQMKSGGGLPSNHAFTLPRAISSGFLLVSVTGFPGVSGEMRIGWTIDGAHAGTTVLAANATPGQIYTFPLGFSLVGALAAGAHALSLRNDLNANMSASQYFTAILFATTSPALLLRDDDDAEAKPGPVDEPEIEPLAE